MSGCTISPVTAPTSFAPAEFPGTQSCTDTGSAPPARRAASRNHRRVDPGGAVGTRVDSSSKPPRQGLSHISRLVELWLSRYELLDDEPVETTIPETAPRQQLAAPAQAQRSQPRPVPTAKVQNTFGWYQSVDISTTG